MNSLFISTYAVSNHMLDFDSDGGISGYFYDPNLFQGSMLQVNTHTLEDQLAYQRMWSLEDDVYSPLPPEDPELCAMLFIGDSEPLYESLADLDYEG